MSEAPYLELNNPDLDLHSGPTHHTAGHTNGTTTGGSAASAFENTKNAILTCKSAMDTVVNSPNVQNLKEQVANGQVCPVAQNVKAETTKTRNEFADLANSRRTPEQPAATGQPLTHYHSMFYRLLSWKNPRATSISFAVSILFIFAARYLNIVRYIFKALYVVLGTTAALEGVGKMAFGKGVTSQFRPNKYYVIPKASLERLTDDVEQFINFFVIELQRVVFAENLPATITAFFTALISYFLIKFVPLWGLTVIGTTVLYMAPLIYIQNREFIDAQLDRAGRMVNQQAHQIRDIAAQQTGNAAKTFQTYTSEYTHLAQDKINQYRGRSASPEASHKSQSSTSTTQKSRDFSAPHKSTVKHDFPAAPASTLNPDFPTVPRTEPVVVEPVVVKPAVPSIEKLEHPAL